MHREQLVVGLRVQEGVLGSAELDAHQQRLDAPDQEERHRRHEEALADLLVVDRPQPPSQAGLGVPDALEVLEGARGDGGGHRSASR